VRFQGEPYGASVSLFIAHHGAALHRHPSAETFVVHTGHALLTACDQQGEAGPTEDRIRAARPPGLATSL
jgi:hypothetical protein